MNIGSRDLVLALIAALLVLVIGSCSNRQLRVRLHIEPGFAGRLRIVENRSRDLDYSRPYDAYQRGETVEMPNGFTKAGRSFRVDGVYEHSGKEGAPGPLVASDAGFGYSSEIGWYFEIVR